MSDPSLSGHKVAMLSPGLCFLQVTHNQVHPELCERCVPVILEMGFEAPQPYAPVAEVTTAAAT